MGVVGSSPTSATKKPLTSKDMKILNLIIKQVYFDAIIAGEKKQEFREIRPSSEAKYCELDDEGFAKFDEKTGLIIPKQYDAIRFFVGYKKDRASALVKVEGAKIELFVDDEGEFIELEQNGESYWAAQVVYDLGEIIESNV